jgi:hypothetical protein
MTKPLLITIHEVRRTRRSIQIAYDKGTGHFQLDEPDNPLPSFTAAFDALFPLVAIIIDVPEEWAALNCRVVGLKLGEQGGAKTVALIVRKGIDDAAKEFAFVTPFRLLAHPTEPGTYTPPLTNAQAALIETLIEEAKRYLLGERAQGEISFGEDDGDPDNAEPTPDAPELPGVTVEPPKAKRGRKPKAKAKDEGAVDV